MKRQNVRVVLGSEYPEMRSFLRGMVESEKNVTVVGEGENAIRMLTETRRLRPDVAIIDSYLPHNIGVDTLPLSRVGGLDTAQIISEELEDTQVILLDRPQDKIVPENKGADGMHVSFFKDNNGHSPFKIGELGDTVVPASALVFAHLEASAKAAPHQNKLYCLGERSFFLGIFGVLAGSFLSLNFGLGAVGFFLAGVAGAAALFGLIAVLICKPPE